MSDGVKMKVILKLGMAALSLISVGVMLWITGVIR